MLDNRNLKELTLDGLQLLCKDIRDNIVLNVSKNGGHLSSNLGVVELTVMLHYVFDLPKDKLLFDVSHQCYSHKLLSGRSLDNLRNINGVSGFYNKEESEYDCYYSGHSSTSISTSLGMAVARDLKQEDSEIIAVIGDASLANGVAMEGLNNLLSLNNKVIVIVNDNGMSIEKSVGGLAKLLNNIKSSDTYQKCKRKYKDALNKGNIRKSIYNCTSRVKDSFKKLIWKDNLLENIGIDYLGVVDGHDLSKLKDALEIAKSNERSIIVHVKTIKGYGCDEVINDDGKWHGVGKFDLNTFETNDNKFNFDDIACDYLCENVSKHNLCVITPAMKKGSRLDKFFYNYPSRSFDVGISEEHAFVFANGLALNGVIPYVSVYSTFMQRSYDFINQDLVRNNSRCVVGVDRVGLVGEDGDSHHGIFDVALVNHLPNVMVCMPIYASDVNDLMDICFNYDGLSFIRFTKEKCVICNTGSKIDGLKWKYLYKGNNSKKVILSVGPISHDLVSKIKENNLDIDVIGVYFIKPIDEEMLEYIKDKYEDIYVYDIYSVKEGLYYPVLEFYNKFDMKVNVSFYGIENKFYKHGKYRDLLEYYKLDVDSLLQHIENKR